MNGLPVTAIAAPPGCALDLVQRRVSDSSPPGLNVDGLVVLAVVRVTKGPALGAGTSTYRGG
jgi:hypothetical protein